MRSIRRSIFETNSSSTHSLTICAKEDYEAWKRGEMIFNKWKGTLISAKDVNYEESQDEDLCTFEEYRKQSEEIEESFYEEHTTKSGDEIVVFGTYVYN